MLIYGTPCTLGWNPRVRLRRHVDPGHGQDGLPAAGAQHPGRHQPQGYPGLQYPRPARRAQGLQEVRLRDAREGRDGGLPREGEGHEADDEVRKPRDPDVPAPQGIPGHGLLGDVEAQEEAQQAPQRAQLSPAPGQRPQCAGPGGGAGAHGYAA